MIAELLSDSTVTTSIWSPNGKLLAYGDTSGDVTIVAVSSWHVARKFNWNDVCKDMRSVSCLKRMTILIWTDRKFTAKKTALNRMII